MDYQKKILERYFYQYDTAIVAEKLLGKYIVRNFESKRIVGKIIETEAYLPLIDQASHGYRGMTARNAVLFGDAGRTYVHSIHRYHCMDLVTEDVNRAGSVLIRAVKPIEGIDMLTNGPGKLCMAFHITRQDNGIDVTNPDSTIIVVDTGESPDPCFIKKSVRVGISKSKDLPLRFYIDKGGI